MTKKLLDSLSSYNTTLAKENKILLGDLGVRKNGKRLVSVPNRAQFVYVRLRTKLSELIEAYNGNQVAQVYDLPVRVKREGNRYIIAGRNTESYSDWKDDNPYLPKHAKAHIFDKDGGNVGGDTVWVYPYQFMPGLVSPFGSRGATNVFIHQTTIRDLEGNWKTVGNTGTERITSFNPVSGSCLVLISIDTVSGNPVYYATTGSYIPEWLTGTSQLISYLDTDYSYNEVPDTFVRLTSGTSAIGWNNLHDVRQFLVPHPTGTSTLTVNGISQIDSIEFSGATVIHTGTSMFIDIVAGEGGGVGSIIIPVEGRLETGTNITEPYLVTSDITLGSVLLYCEDYGITGSLTVDVLRNGLSIFSGSSPLVANYNYTGTYLEATPYTTSLVKGDILTLDIPVKSQGSENLIVGLVPSNGGGASLTVEQSGGTPSIIGVNKIIAKGLVVESVGTGEVQISSPDYILIRDEKPNGTSGGTFTAGAWQTRDLTTISSDVGGHCSLNSNQFTLEAGTYECKISAPGFSCGRHVIVLYNITDGGIQTEVYGTSEHSPASSSQTRSSAIGKFTITESKTFEVRHRCQTTFATYGMGVEANFGNPEIYTIAEFWKVG